MSKGELLYFKGMKMPESEEEEDSEDDDIWDDSKLTAAYDKAVSMANAEIARRVAMSTNNRGKAETTKETLNKTKSSKSQSKPKNTDTAINWKAGMACSAVYDFDGLEYEAFILRIINDEECVVRFLGYENSEIVAISSLKPSLGKEARAKQIQDALEFSPADEEAKVAKTETLDVESDRIHSEASSASQPKKKKSKKKKHNRASFEMPRDFPMPMPNIADFANIGMPEMPIPPPPVTVLRSEGPSSADQALSSMLLSWYMSGYCTGYYQGMTRAKQSRKKHHHH